VSLSNWEKAQDLVAEAVPVGVVDVLEMIEVDHDARERSAGALMALVLRREHALHVARL
jgi:hypothetical protein